MTDLQRRLQREKYRVAKEGARLSRAKKGIGGPVKDAAASVAGAEHRQAKTFQRFLRASIPKAPPSDPALGLRGGRVRL